MQDTVRPNVFPNARPNDAPKWVWSQNGITLGKYLVWAHVQLGTTLGTSIGTFWAVIWASLHRNVRKLSFCVNLFDLLWFFKEYYHHELLYGLVLGVITPYQRAFVSRTMISNCFPKILHTYDQRSHIAKTHYWNTLQKQQNYLKNATFWALTIVPHEGFEWDHR